MLMKKTSTNHKHSGGRSKVVIALGTPLFPVSLALQNHRKQCGTATASKYQRERLRSLALEKMNVNLKRPQCGMNMRCSHS
jgi:hypothetical protein